MPARDALVQVNLALTAVFAVTATGAAVVFSTTWQWIGAVHDHQDAPVIRQVVWWQSNPFEFGLGQHIDGLAVMALILVAFAALIWEGSTLEEVVFPIGDVPVVDVCQLSAAQQEQLTAAYRAFLLSKGKDRGALDAAVLNVLALPPAFAASLGRALDRMQHLSDAVLEPMAMDPHEGNTWPEELRLL